MAAGSRLAVGSSRNSTVGIAGERAREREPLLLAAGQPPRRTLARLLEPDQREQFADARIAVRARDARRSQAHSGYWRRRCAGASPGAGTRWRAASAATSSRPPQVMRPRDGVDQTHGGAQQRGLAGAVRADQHGRRAGCKRER